MSDFRLIRMTDDGKCTTGHLITTDPQRPPTQTLERPWMPGPKGGVPGQSCVPAGLYQLALHDSESHPRSFALVNEALGVYHLNLPLNAEGRTACLIHVANYVQELRGCIALGVTKVPYMGSWMLKQSKIAVDNFYALAPWIEGHTLEIIGP